MTEPKLEVIEEETNETPKTNGNAPNLYEKVLEGCRLNVKMASQNEWSEFEPLNNIHNSIFSVSQGKRR